MKSDQHGRAAEPSGDSGQIEGRNAVIEALRSGRTIDKLYVVKDKIEGQLGYIVSTARAAGAVISQCDRRKLDALSRTGAHQGVIAVAAVREYVPLEQILEAAAARENPTIVICDGVTDPHNLGAIIRTADAAGVSGIVIPKRGSAGLTAVVAKTSAGAVEYVPVARVSNIPSTIRTLKEKGYWIFGSDLAGSTALSASDFNRPSVVIIGSEGEGIGRLVLEMCDYVINIPMRGKINSLNASVAAGVILFEIVRQQQDEFQRG